MARRAGQPADDTPGSGFTVINIDSLLRTVLSIRPRPDHNQLSFVVRPLPDSEETGWIGRNNHSGVAFLLRSQ